ncbi:YkvI family membrane protein [Paenibacillus pini]|uniref:Membrane protein n=1 Tax=Paenibacillus pini JCM 16418 TaxID=1236976 RepID=W7Y6I6_9BACL|nr:membrane protein [Paenibacillus pini]GAF06515.1 membrane protein [Paenibacillus pini JCM 16418]
MKNFIRVLQIAFTYIGTVVGAGFATGQEILQFFTQYGKWATLTIFLATAMFIWLGTKMMMMSRRISARSYEDLNKHLFGPKAGGYISIIMLFILIGVNSIMLAGAGSVFMEHLNLHYQTGLILTIIGTYFLLNRGMNAIMNMNSIVVPMMLTLSVLIVVSTVHLPNANRFLTLTTDHHMFAVWLAPLLYTAFNLVMAQAVLVPLGSKTESIQVVKWGGILGGIGVGFMLLAAHIALSAQMPGILQFEIPMGSIAFQLGAIVQIIYIVLIFMEIFTTFVADIYGVTLQLQQRLSLSPKLISIIVMMICYMLSQIGFSSLLSVLYPLFGCLSMLWAIKLIFKSK